MDLKTQQLMGFNLVSLDETDSTNIFIKKNLYNFPEGNSVVKANFQTQGKGQNKKEWVGEKNKNLYCSLLLTNDYLAHKNPFIINKAIALSVHHCIADYILTPNYIKWPNDIIVKDNKISGILIENSFAGNSLKYSICGIGININQIKFYKLKATSLKAITNCSFKTKDILKSLLKHINLYLNKLENNLDLEIESEFDNNLYRVNLSSIFIIKNTPTQGIIHSCNSDGNLLININGSLNEFSHGQLIFNPQSDQNAH